MRYILVFLIVSGMSVLHSQTDLLLTDFQSGIPASYTLLDNDGLTPDISVSAYTNAWITVVDPENAADTVASATSFFSPSGTADRWLITPPLSLGNYGNFIEWQAKSQDASYADDYLVLVSTTDNQPSSFTDTIGYVIQENPDWTTRTVDLSIEGYNGQTIYVAFRLITTDGFKLYVDDIHVWKNDPAGITEQKATTFTCYPNPSSDVITIQTSTPLLMSHIRSLDGTLVFSTVAKTISVKDLPSGTYILTVETDETSEAIRFVKN